VVEILYFYRGSEWQSDGQDDIENTRWLELLRQFTAVKDLYLLGISTQTIVPTLEALIGGGITDVFPAVQNILEESIVVSGLVQETLGGLSLHDSSPVPL
jgi:hypothetical protein